jgi:hypothetical protein
MRFWSFALAAFFSLCVLTRGTTVIQPTFEQLVDGASQVVVAEALSSECHWQTNAKGALIFTTVRFRAEEVLKGESVPQLELSFLGGTIGADTLDVHGVPRFTQGSRYILFVSSNRTEVCPLVGMFHGKFHLIKDAVTGEETISQHDGSPVRISSSSQGAKAALPLRNLSAAEFKQRVMDRVATTH